MRRLLLTLSTVPALGCPGVEPTLDEVGDESTGTTDDTTSTTDETAGTTDATDDTTETGSPDCPDEQVEIGDGCMGLSQLISIAAMPTDLLLAELSGDGLLDLVVANQSEMVNLYIGNGGSFAAALPIPGSSARGVAAGDIDDNAQLDLAVVGPGSVMLYPSLGDGIFSPPTSIMLTNGWDAVFGQIDGDDDQDLVVSDAGLPGIRVFTNDAGSFTPVVNLGAGNPHTAILADVDGDDDLDLAAADFGMGLALVHENMGSGSGDFSSAMTFMVPLAYDIAAADLDEDGRDELLVVDNEQDNVVVLDVTQGFDLEEASVHAVGPGPRRIAVGDIDGDGRLDAVVAIYGSGGASILLGDGVGLSDAIHLPSTPETEQAESIAVGDLDGDGRAEVLIGGLSTGHVSVYAYLD